MALPKRCTTTDTTGSGSSASRVSPGDRDSIRTRATTKVIEVEAAYMIAGPASMRTADRSFVARDIRSPVRLAWNHAGGRRWR